MHFQIGLGDDSAKLLYISRCEAISCFAEVLVEFTPSAFLYQERRKYIKSLCCIRKVLIAKQLVFLREIVIPPVST